MNAATEASQSGINSSGNNAGLSKNNGIPRKLIIPQKVSCDLAAAAKSQETFWGIINFLGMPLFLLSPALFPLELMPDWLASVAAFNPVSYTVILVREMMSGYVDSLSAMTSIAVLGIFSIVMIGLASYVFTRDVNKPF